MDFKKNRMSDIQLEEVPEGKVYSTLSIRIATFFGGIAVGAFMLAENFKVLGERRKATVTWVVAILIFILLVSATFIPFLDRIPPLAYPLIYAIVAGLAARHYQGNLINEHIEKGGDVYSAGRVVVVALIGLVITAAFLLLIYLMVAAIAERQ